MKRRFLATVALTLCIAAPHASADEPIRARAAVVLLDAINLEREQAEARAEALRQALAEVLAVEVVSRDETAASAAEVIPGCAQRPECVRALGAALVAQELLFMSIVRIGSRVKVTFTWADGGSGASEDRAPVAMAFSDDAKAAFVEVADGLLPRVSPRARARAETSDDGAAKPGEEPEGGAPSDGQGGLGSAAIPPANDAAPAGRRATTGVLIAGGVAALALAGGTVLGLQALATEGELEDARDSGCGAPPCPVDSGRRDDLIRQRDRADLLFATAVVAGAVAGVLYWRSGSGDTAVHVSALPSQAGVFVTGRF